ncbi:MAG TPA: alkane 1-monooxygenase [Rhodobacteraceae bacterium]|jgi:luciferase family oxidoreductase group 1|nr:alkane 1-monooxygenase [Paracoccaceae bacterium]HBV53865.1 alkane 1-monooxygenase [Paracoccaceae bacterium]
MKYSILDLSPIPEGGTARDAIENSATLAQTAEGHGYTRFWLAEHHNMPGIASAATALVISHVAAATRTLRVGAGGIMLPNHSPLVIAEQFGTLATLYPDRIDLGLGRAPGTDMPTARALRRHMAQEDTFPQDVLELASYFGTTPQSSVRAIPGIGTQVPLYILGSSLYGAQLAAYLGLPYAFASHFAPDALDDALATYRATFRPSDTLHAPYAIMAAGAFLAETDDDAHFLRSSQLLAFARLRTGTPGPLPRPTSDLSEISPMVRRQVDHALSVSVTGSPKTAKLRLNELVKRYAPDEMIFSGAIHDPEKRVRSFELLAEVVG